MAINFKIGFTIDDSELKKGLAGVRKDIENAFNIKNGLSKELESATQQALVLEKALSRATTDKGVSHFTFTSELRKAGTSATELVSKLTAGGDQFRDSLNAANRAIALSNREVISLNSKIKEMARVMVQSFKFTTAQNAIQALSSAVQEAYHWVTDLHDAINDIAVVTGKTGSELTTLTESAIKSAKQLRVAASDYAEGALIFYQQGLNDKEVERRNEITIKAAKAANTSIQEMSSQLTAIWNTYGMIGEQQERAASVGAKMAAQTAVDFRDIAEAMQTAAAPAAQMGVSFDSLASIIATVGDTTQQSASIIGNAFKTIFSRFEQLKSDGTDGEVTLSAVSQQLSDLGVQVLDQSGNLRELDDVIQEVGNNWESWSDKQQLAIAQLVGGTRQYGQFLALMNNFDKYQQNLQAAQAEGGETLEQQYTQALNSIESRVENAAEAWKRAFGELIDTNAIKGVLSAVETLGNMLDSILKAFGGFPGILALAGSLLARNIVPMTKQLVANVQTIFRNRTVEGRAQSINAEYDAMQAGIGSTTNADNAAQLQKLQGNRQVALNLNLLNEELKTATGEYKIQLEYQKQQLINAQDQLQVYIDQNAELAKKYEAMQKEKVLTEREARKNLNTINDKLTAAQIKKEESEASLDSQTSKNERKKIRKEINELDAEIENLKQQLYDAMVQVDQAKIIKQTGDLRDRLLKFNEGALNGKVWKNNIEAIVRRTIGGSNNEIKQLTDEIWNKYNNEAKSGNNHAMSELVETIKKLVQQRYADMFGSMFDDTVFGTENVAAMLDKIEKNGQIKGGKEGEKPLGFDPDKLATSLGNASAGITMMISAASNLFDVLRDESAPASEKLMALVSTLTMLPGILSSLKAAATSLKELGGIFTNLGTGATMGIIAVIGAAIFVIIQGIKAIQSQTPEAKLEKLNEELDETKNTISEIQSSFDSYDSAVQRLKECTRGTVEWRNALDEVNNQVGELLEKYPELSKYITVDENGALTFKPGAEEEIMSGYQSNLLTQSAQKSSQEQRIRQNEIDSLLSAIKGAITNPDILSRVLENPSLYANMTYDQLSEALGQDYPQMVSAVLSIQDILKDYTDKTLENDQRTEADFKILAAQAIAGQSFSDNQEIDSAVKSNAWQTLQSMVNNEGIPIEDAVAQLTDRLKELNYGLVDTHDEMVKFSQDLYDQAQELENAKDEAEAYKKVFTDRYSSTSGKIAAEDSLNAAIYMGESAEKYGLDAEVLEEQAKNIRKVYAEEKLTAEQSAKVAVNNQRMNDGIEVLSENWENWKEILNNSSKASDEYAETVVGITKAVKDLIGATGDFELPEDFLLNPDNLQLVEEAANGSIEAINKLGLSIAESQINELTLDEAFVQNLTTGTSVAFETAQQTIIGVIDEIRNHLDELSNGKSLSDILGEDEVDFINSLNHMAAVTGMTVEEMNGLLSEIGVTANVTTDYVKQKIKIPQYEERVEPMPEVKMMQWNQETHQFEQTSSYIPYRHSTVMLEPKEEWSYVPVAQISTDGKDHPIKYTGSTRTYSPPSGSSSSGSSGGSGGGGGGSFSPKKSSSANSKPLAERYSNIQSAIDKNTRAIERYTDAADDAWGAARYRDLQRINNVLENQADKLRILQKEAEHYLEIDQGDLQSKLKRYGLGEAVFNSDGFVSNRENIIARLEAMRKPLADEVQRLIDQYNAGGVANEALEQQIDAAEEKLNEFNEDVQQTIMDALEQSDETAQKVFDTMQERLDNIREWMSNKVEMSNLRLELGISIDETDIRIMEHLIDLWGDLGTEMGRNWQHYEQIVADSISKVNRYLQDTSRMHNLLDRINPNGSVSLNGSDQSWFEAQFGKDAWQKYINGNGGLPAEVIDQLESDVESGFSAVEEAQDALRSMLQEWVNLFEIYIDRFDKIADQIAASAETLDMYTELMTAMGKDQSGRGTQTMLNLAKAQYDNARNQTELAKAQMNMTNNAYNSALRELNDFYAMYGTDKNGWTENQTLMYQELQNWVDTAESAYNDAVSQFKSGIQEMASAFTAEMEAETNALRAALVEDIGSVFTDWDSMLEMFGLKRDQNQYYLDLLTKDYELDKLGSSIQDYMDNNPQLESMQQYQELLDEVNGLLGEGVQMNQTDLEVLQKKFELMQAQDAYEEAMSQKNTMRLMRDASGNYNYVYSSDMSAGASGEDSLQRVKDLTYEIEKLQQDAAEAAEEQWLETYARIMELDEERNTARYQNDEQYRAYIDAQLAIELENLNRYAEEIGKRYDEIDKDFTESELYWLMGEQELQDGTQLCLDNMAAYHQYFVEKHHEYTNELNERGKWYVEQFNQDVQDIGEGTEELGGHWELLEDKIDQYVNDMVDSSLYLRDTIWDLSAEGSQALDELASNLGRAAADMVNQLDEVTDAIYREMEALQQLRNAQLSDMDVSDYGFDATRDYAASVNNFIQEQLAAGKTKEEIEAMEEYKRYAYEVYNKKTDAQMSEHGYYDPNLTLESVFEDFSDTVDHLAEQVDKWQKLDERDQSSVSQQVGNQNSYFDPNDKYHAYATGGLGDYRGPAWIDGSPTAPELILNPSDTANILAAVSQVRSSVSGRLGTLGRRSLGNGFGVFGINPGESVQQAVHIDATFPNVSVAAEIEEALASLLRQVSQYNVNK